MSIRRSRRTGFHRIKRSQEVPTLSSAGLPAKPFSNANRHTRLEDHPDSDLLMQYMRIVEKLNPKVFAIENVPEVLTACDGSYYAAVQEKAESFGYELVSSIVPGLEGGRIHDPQARCHRWQPYRKAVSIQHWPCPWYAQCWRCARQGRPDMGELRRYLDVERNDAQAHELVPQGGNYTSIPEEYRTESKNRHSCTYRRLAWNEPAPTITNWRKPPLIHRWKTARLRWPKPRRCKACEGLPCMRNARTETAANWQLRTRGHWPLHQVVFASYA